MRARLVTAVAIAAAIGALGGLAVAAANQVSTTPAPIPVVDRTAVADPEDADRGGEVDDHGDDRSTTTLATAPTQRTVPDDRAGDRPTGISDDPAGHDVGDDHGGSGGTVAPTTTVAPTPTSSGPSPSSGSGSGGSEPGGSESGSGGSGSGSGSGGSSGSGSGVSGGSGGHGTDDGGGDDHGSGGGGSDDGGGDDHGSGGHGSDG